MTAATAAPMLLASLPAQGDSMSTVRSLPCKTGELNHGGEHGKRTVLTWKQITSGRPSCRIVFDIASIL